MVALPVVESLHPGTEAAELVVFLEALDAHSVGSLQSTSSTGLVNELLRCVDRSVERLDESLVIMLG
jgi:hypothetical protein